MCFQTLVYWMVTLRKLRNGYKRFGDSMILKKDRCTPTGLHDITNIRFVTEESKKPTRCHLLVYCTSYRLNMFQALLCPSSGARDYDVVYHIGRYFLVCCRLEVRCG